MVLSTTLSEKNTQGNGKRKRFSRDFPCPVCGGYDEANRESGFRCGGYLATDLQTEITYARCTNSKHAGNIQRRNDGTFPHRMDGKPCRCGAVHNDLNPGQKPIRRNGSGHGAAPKRKIAARYDYLDENGEMILQVCRTEPKGFFQRRPDGAGNWITSLEAGEYFQAKNKKWYTIKKAETEERPIPDNAPRRTFPAARRVLYRLPQLLKADPSEPVFTAEGEKDVHNLEGIGCVATCNPEGAGKWHHVAEQAPTVLAGRPIVILPDNDDSGQSHAQDVARSLHGAAASIKVVNLPGLPEKGDVSDWIEARKAERMTVPEIKAALLELVNAAPEWTPSVTSPAGAVEMAPVETKPICLADIDPVPVSWLWYGRIARGKITLIAGNPGLGKSFLALDLAARVSTGAAFPDGTPGCPGKALLLSAEDDLSDTIRPRLDAAGADCGNILARRYGDLGNLDAQLPQLETDLKNERPVLLVIDPITAFLGRLDAHRNDEIRSLFARLTELAARYGVAVVVISHLNKSTAQGTALHRVTGSLGFTAAARAAYLVERDPANPDDRLFLPLKNNLGEDLTGFRFRLIGEPGSVPCLEWDPDPVTITADEVLAQKSGKEPTAQAEAEAWLRDALADGPLESNRLRQMALRDGYSWTTLKRAKKSIGAVAKRDRFHEGQWFWSLPEEDQSDETWSPSDFTSEEDQPSPKKTKINEHETWSSSANLVPFDESSPAPCEEDQPTDTWSSSTDKSPVDESGPVVEEEF